MKNTKLKQFAGEGALLLCAFIWGTTFVAQSVATDYIGAFTFQFIRSILAFVILLPLALFLQKQYKGKEQFPKVLYGGVICGSFLMVASCLQQIGIKYTTVGKAGFLTSLYLILVALFCIVIGRKMKASLLIAILLATVGIYLISGASGLDFAFGDVLIILCAVFFAFQIMFVDYYVKFCNPVMLSCIQFFTSAVLSGIAMLIFDDLSNINLASVAFPLLYAGIMSSGVAYTLQIVGQKYANPAIATLLMSFESVFSLLSGMIILNESISTRELFGCIIMFIAVILSQLDLFSKLKA